MLLNKQQLKDIRHHLTTILHKYSDADSSILSDYIVALLSKDGAKSQIRKDCSSELSAFMNEKTEQFVAELFTFINNKVLIDTPTDRGRAQTKHNRKVEVQSQKSARNNIVITRSSNDINESQSNAQQTDFVVNTPSRSPSKSLSPKHKRNYNAINNHNNHHNNNNHQNNYRSKRRRNDMHRNHHNNHNQHKERNASNPANIEALTTLLGLVQQNIQNAQIQNQNKAFRALNHNPALGLLGAYVPRPIIQHTAAPTPKLIVTNNKMNNNNKNNNNITTTSTIATTAVNSNANGSRNNGNNNILDQRLDELRLPPNNNPFYQDDRFQNMAQTKQVQINKNLNQTAQKYVGGKKRNFSKMNDDQNRQKPKYPKTEFTEKRQVYVFNIASHLNTMTRLTSHFEQFGDIQHIQVHRDNNKAFVQFSKHSEAMDALNSPDPILNDASIQIVWAHYNRRDYQRNAQHNDEDKEENNANINTVRRMDINHNEGDEDEIMQQNQEKKKKAVSLQWISSEYKEKIVNERPKKKQKLSPKQAAVKIPCDMSENIEKLKKRLHESLKMYETLETNASTKNEDVEELKSTLKKTIETIEIQMKKLMEHQRKRQEILLSVEEKENKEKKQAQLQTRGRTRGRGRGSRGRGFSNGRWRARGRMRGRGRGSRGGRGRGYRGRYMRGYRGIRGAYRGRWRGNNARRGNIASKKTKNVSVDYRSSSLMCDNLPQNCDEHELRVHFLKFGHVETIDLLHANRAKITFSKRSEAVSAISNGKELKSNVLKLKFTEHETSTNCNENVCQNNMNHNHVEILNNKEDNELKVYEDLPQTSSTATAAAVTANK